MLGKNGQTTWKSNLTEIRLHIVLKTYKKRI